MYIFAVWKNNIPYFHLGWKIKSNITCKIFVSLTFSKFIRLSQIKIICRIIAIRIFYKKVPNISIFITIKPNAFLKTSPFC